MGACFSSSSPITGQSSPWLLDASDGGDVEYHERFLEDAVIGQGEFGQVKLIIDMRQYNNNSSSNSNSNNDNINSKKKKSKNSKPSKKKIPTPPFECQPVESQQQQSIQPSQSQPQQSLYYACKILRKGLTFKDNTLYSPIRPEILRGEVTILRRLTQTERNHNHHSKNNNNNNNNNNSNTADEQDQEDENSITNHDSHYHNYFCLQLVAVYESPKALYICTEYCGGGALMEHVASISDGTGTPHHHNHNNNNGGELPIVRVQTIAFQLLSAVAHCARHRVLHRDIKPDNIMFMDASPNAQLRLIDFGSGTADPFNTTTTTPHPVIHKTFCGSAFYTSPELFQRHYTNLTDVWSVGVVLYVLVAGYPAHALQKAFNLLHTGGGGGNNSNNNNNKRNVRTLPNIPQDLPEAFYALLDAALTYRHKHRSSAQELLTQYSTFLTMDAAATDAMTKASSLSSMTTSTARRSSATEFLSIEQVAAAAAAAATNPLSAEGTTLPRLFHNNNSNNNHHSTTPTRTVSGSVRNHSIFLQFQHFERSVTAILATFLAQSELERLVLQLEAHVVLPQESEPIIAQEPAQARPVPVQAPPPPQHEQEEKKDKGAANEEDTETLLPIEPRLGVILMRELKAILSSLTLTTGSSHNSQSQNSNRNAHILATIENLPHAAAYENFAYHISMLYEFLDVHTTQVAGVRRMMIMSADRSNRSTCSSRSRSRSRSRYHHCRQPQPPQPPQKQHRLERTPSSSSAHSTLSNASTPTGGGGAVLRSWRAGLSGGGSQSKHSHPHQQVRSLTASSESQPNNNKSNNNNKPVPSSVHGSMVFSSAVSPRQRGLEQ